MIKVLQVFGGLNRGGSETMVMNLYRNIDRSEIQFDFVKHVSQHCAYEDEILSLGGKIYTAPNYNFINHFRYCKWWNKFFTEHPEYKIIHGHYFTLASVFFKIAHKFNRITIAHSHIAKIRIVSLKKFLSRLYLLKLPKYSDILLACSQDAGKWVFGKRPFTVINNAIDVCKFVFSADKRIQIRNEFNLQGKFILGNIGRLTIQKNQSFLIDIFAEVHKQNNNSVLLIVGEGELEKSLKERARSLGLSDCVIFTGSRGDVPALLSAMDVFVFPSLWEGLGIVAIEAQTAGLRTICSDAVPREAKVTNLLEFIPLTSSATLWAKYILNQSVSCSRSNLKQEIIDAGYDIHTTVNQIQNFYLNLECHK